MFENVSKKTFEMFSVVLLAPSWKVWTAILFFFVKSFFIIEGVVPLSIFFLPKHLLSESSFTIYKLAKISNSKIKFWSKLILRLHTLLFQFCLIISSTFINYLPIDLFLITCTYHTNFSKIQCMHVIYNERDKTNIITRFFVFSFLHKQPFKISILGD